MESKPSSSAAVWPVASVAAEPPTTYVQADPHTFRDLVQRLTGAPSTPSSKTSPSSSAAVGPRRSQSFKLHDRRGPSVRRLEVQLCLTSLRSPRCHPAAPKSPGPSPVTPLVSDPVFSPPALIVKHKEEDDEAERRAIKEKGFYLRPSPRGSVPPELLTLFPLCSPKKKTATAGGGEICRRHQTLGFEKQDDCICRGILGFIFFYGVVLDCSSLSFLGNSLRE